MSIDNNNNETLPRTSPRKLLRSSLILIALFAVFAFWYVEASNFSDGNVPGTYELRRDGEWSILVLQGDHTFHQRLYSGATTKSASGSWRLFPSDSQSHIQLSKEFLKLSGQELNPDGTAYGQLENYFGLLSITMAPNPDGPRLHKKLFRTN